MSESETLSHLLAGNQLFTTIIPSGQIFALGRLGSVEAQIIEAMQRNSKVTLQQRKLAWINAGIAYPSNSQLKSFLAEYCHSLAQMDLMAYWPANNILNQDALIAEYGWTATQLVPLRILDPVKSFVSGVPENEMWIQALRDKNVLVISPFAETISEQYLKRKELHQVKLLPNFHLKTIAPPSTNRATFLKGGY
jgi:hypothetical protein